MISIEIAAISKLNRTFGHFDIKIIVMYIYEIIITNIMAHYRAIMISDVKYVFLNAESPQSVISHVNTDWEAHFGTKR